jgi:hypothetical protein
MNVAGGRWLPSLPANEELNWLLLCLLVLDSKQRQHESDGAHVGEVFFPFFKKIFQKYI